ncbi:MAG: glycosyltransferase family 4 protein [Chloroflexi bacterium]|nr:glycosyltransferase family 4 protein [Chloroflexota bacterium]
MSRPTGKTIRTVANMRVLMLSKACIVGIYQPKLEAIARRGVDLTVLVPPAWRDERGLQRLERSHTAGYQLRQLPIRFNGNFHLHHYPTLGREMRQRQPQLVHIDEEPYNLATWQALYHARRLGAKSLFFSWQNILRAYPPPFSWGEGYVLRKADYALAGTEAAADVLRRKGYAGSLATIPQFGTSASLFKPAETRPARPFTIGYIGRIVPEKGLRILLRAARQLDGEWRLRLIGGGSALAEMAALAQSLAIGERVDFSGQLPSADLPAEYHKLDALVLPSLTRANWKEQFGRVLVEAMASGLPVIGSDSGAIPGVIGDAGLVVPEGDVEALAGALRELRDQPALRQDLIEKGTARFLAHFTHERIAEATVAVYREMLNLS